MGKRDFYICDECTVPYQPEKIYNPLRNYFICTYCLPEKLVSKQLQERV